jgi:hypothetical protein
MEAGSMNTITYALRADELRSDRYYEDIKAFTDEVIDHAEQLLGAPVTAFQAWVTTCEEPRTDPEYLYELLALGVFWQVYAPRALKLGRPSQRVLSALARWRQRDSAIQPIIDTVRGALATIFLARNGHMPLIPAVPTPAHLDRLLDWLAASGEFEQEVERLRAWHAFLAEQPPDDTHRYLAALLAFTDWFARRSLDVLGRYTPQVETFLAETYPGYRWREDVIFCGRQRIEYHLCMVGTEIMNRAFRAAFNATGQKIVLVPPCMRARPADECQARETPFGAQCAACEPRCRVHQVTKLGEKHGFAVFMLPKELASLSPGAGSRAALAGLGIVGVSCPLTNPQGGWKTRTLGIHAQGLLLDYCGCSWHWHPDGGIPTDINFHELLRLLEVPGESQNLSKEKSGDAVEQNARHE